MIFDRHFKDVLDVIAVYPLPPQGTNPVPRYGGGFDEGAAAIYNGTAIVAQSVLRVCLSRFSFQSFQSDFVKGTPVIYVNFGYRLGPLGFPQGQEADNRGALNLGG